MTDYSSMEFDLFEDVRRRLTSVFEGQGHDPIVAERAALYVVQGMREVHKLIATLTRENRPDDAILRTLERVFENAPALDKARAILAGYDDGKPALH